MSSKTPEQVYRQAELRLRAALLGDGEYSAGAARGEEARELVIRELRKMRRAFESALDARDDALRVLERSPADAVAEETTLDAELTAAASRTVRRRPKGTPKRPGPRKTARSRRKAG